MSKKNFCLVSILCTGVAIALPPQVDSILNMDQRIQSYNDMIPSDRPFWIEVTRTTTSNTGWRFTVIGFGYFGTPGYTIGSTIGFYDDLGSLLFTNRQSSSENPGSAIGFGTGYSPLFGVGSPNLPDLNRRYYLGVAGVDRDFLPNYGFTAGTDSGRFVASVTPSPSSATAIIALAIPLASRRRR
jgi:hypothetical protein